MMREKLEALAKGCEEMEHSLVHHESAKYYAKEIKERIRAILAAEPEPGLRAEDLRRLAIYSVATCDINGGNKRDRPAILLEQAITALALTPPQKPERWVCHGCGAEWNRQPGNHWYMDNQGKPCGPVEPHYKGKLTN